MEYKYTAQTHKGEGDGDREIDERIKEREGYR